MNAEKINVLLVDDHSMVIEGMKVILAQISKVSVKATAANAIEAIAALRVHSIAIAFVDINLPDISGIELCNRIKSEFPQIHVLGLSTFSQRSYISQMISNGASGYLLKSAGKAEIELAIDAVIGGKMFFSTDISNTTIERAAKEETPTLTRREKEILRLIAEGMTTNEIAKVAFVSPYTVDTHRKNLLSKFDVCNTALLIKTAVSLGLI